MFLELMVPCPCTASLAFTVIELMWTLSLSNDRNSRWIELKRRVRREPDASHSEGLHLWLFTSQVAMLNPPPSGEGGDRQVMLGLCSHDLIMNLEHGLLRSRGSCVLGLVLHSISFLS